MLVDTAILPSVGAAILLCLAVSALGFIRTDWFISIGYGLSIAAQAILFAILWPAGLTPLVVLQLLLLFAYGARLAGYLVARERAPSFARELEASRERSRRITTPIKFAIWVTVSLLYVCMASPALFNLASPGGAAPPTLVVGVLVMLGGLAMEALADAQKAGFKARNPRRFVDTGLYGVVRCPNYLGEMIFWVGGFIAALAAYQTVLAWLMASIGLVCIVLIMLGSARRLEIKQAERYAGDDAYSAYVRRVPILLPFLPLYSLRNLKVYLG